MGQGSSVESCSVVSFLVVLGFSVVGAIAGAITAVLYDLLVGASGYRAASERRVGLGFEWFRSVWRGCSGGFGEDVVVE